MDYVDGGFVNVMLILLPNLTKRDHCVDQVSEDSAPGAGQIHKKIGELNNQLMKDD